MNRIILSLVAASSAVALFACSSAPTTAGSTKGASTSCALSSHFGPTSGACVDADGDQQDDSCCGQGSDCETYSTTCVESASACSAGGGSGSTASCSGSTTGNSYCCSFDTPSPAPAPAPTAPASSCGDSAHVAQGGGCVDADGNQLNQTCCGNGSNCEQEDGASCVDSASTCTSLGGNADGNDCSGSTSGNSFCCSFSS